MAETENAVSRLNEVERWLHEIYVATDEASLRQEDHRKAVQVTAMLDEIELAARRLSRRAELTLVDAAAGKSYVGLLAAKLLFEPEDRPARVVTIEADPDRVEKSRRGLERLGTRVPVDLVAGDVADPLRWPNSAIDCRCSPRLRPRFGQHHRPGRRGRGPGPAARSLLHQSPGSCLCEG